jgi:hypothetical protein
MNDYRRMQELRIDIISGLYKRGYSYTAMREEVMARLNLPTYSLRTVKKDVDRMLAEWRKTRIDNLDSALQLELERTDDIMREAWVAWEKSKQDGERVRTTRKGKKDKESGKIETTGVTQYSEEFCGYGDTRYLDVVLRASVERRKMLGLYAPEKKEVSGEFSFESALMQTGLADTDEEREG